MAEYIRNIHDLAAIRVRLRPERSGMILSFASFSGTKELERREVPAEAVGIRRELSVQSYRWAQPELPPATYEPLCASLLATASADEPFWLQVGTSAGHLAVVPWERFLQPALGRPLLRIPNFIADPVFLSGPLRAAVVVSSPRAKTPFSVKAHVHQLVEAAQEGVPGGTELHVFADVEAFPSLRNLDALPGHDVVVHDPAAAEDYGEGGTAFDAKRMVGLDSRLESPWLRWIRGVLGNGGLDLVHFVCPGFFRREQGALALARSPGHNEDRRWSHFVGADELIAFLDLVGAWSVGFSPPYDNLWAIGLRMLADRLAWQRPGALFVYDSEHGSFAELEGLYRFLYAVGDADPPSSPGVALYTHPRRLERYRTHGVEAYAGSLRRGYGVGEGEAIPEQLVMLALKGNRADQAKDKRPRAAWRRTNALQLDRMLLDLGRSDTPARRGTLDALQALRAIYDKAERASGGGATERGGER